MEYPTLETPGNKKGTNCHKAKQIKQESRWFQFITSPHKLFQTQLCRKDTLEMSVPTAQLLLFTGKRCLTWKCSHLLCFRGSP